MIHRHITANKPILAKALLVAWDYRRISQICRDPELRCAAYWDSRLEKNQRIRAFQESGAVY
jgi:hypothetical protein